MVQNRDWHDRNKRPPRALLSRAVASASYFSKRHRLRHRHCRQSATSVAASSSAFAAFEKRWSRCFAGSRNGLVLSLEPRVFLYPNFLLKEECKHLIELAKPHMVRSKVYDGISPHGEISSLRTNTGAYLMSGSDAIIREIDRRIADISSSPLENGENLYVLHYEVGQKFEPHYDCAIDPIARFGEAGQRVATILMYLSDVEEGGETVFPYAKVTPYTPPEYRMLYDQGLVVKPKQGDALLFWNIKPDGSSDQYSMHGGCPVVRGNKWACTKWIHTYKYRHTDNSN